MTDKRTGTVFNAKPYPVDLHDGRTLAPSETADDIELDNEHNRNLVLDGAIVVREGYTPRTSDAAKRQAEIEAAAKAAEAPDKKKEG